jgi:hypothetical protein
MTIPRRTDFKISEKMISRRGTHVLVRSLIRLFLGIACIWFIVNVIVMNFLDKRKIIHAVNKNINSVTDGEKSITANNTDKDDLIHSIENDGKIPVSHHHHSSNLILSSTNDTSTSRTRSPPSQTFPKLVLSEEYTSSSSDISELCLVTSWGQGQLPDYAYSMFESVVNNRDYVKLLVFHHKTDNLPDKETRRKKYKNIDFIDVAHLAADGSYREAGFPRFLADRICGLFGETSRFSVECERLYAAFGFIEYQQLAAPGIVQGNTITKKK